MITKLYYVITMSTIKEPQDLDVYKLTIDLICEIYQITRLFPNEEKFGIISQLRRATISIASNIAEGFGRFSIKEKIYFYKISTGSLQEVKSLLYISTKLNYIQQSQFIQFNNTLIRINKMLNKMVSILKLSSYKP